MALSAVFFDVGTDGRGACRPCNSRSASERPQRSSSTTILPSLATLSRTVIGTSIVGFAIVSFCPSLMVLTYAVVANEGQRTPDDCSPENSAFLLATFVVCAHDRPADGLFLFLLKGSGPATLTCLCVYPFRKMLLRSFQPTLRTSRTSERYLLTCTGRAGRHDDPRRNGSSLVILEFVQHAKDSRLP